MAVVFNDKHIYLISGKGKRSRKAFLQEIRDTLAKHKDDINVIIQTTGLNTDSITSIFRDDNRNLETVIKMLFDNKDALAELIVNPFKSRAENLQEGRLFYAEDVYKIPGLKNNELGKCINIIKDHMPKLKLLCTKISPREITDRLSNIPVDELGKTIDEMYSNMPEKFDSNAIIPKGSDKKIMIKPTKRNKPEDPTLIVYQTSEGGAYKTVPTPNSPNERKIDALIAKKENLPLGSVNWLITSQTNPKEAVDEAAKYHHRYKSPEEMRRLRQKREEKPLKTFVNREESREAEKTRKESPVR